MNKQDKIFGIANKITKHSFEEIWGIEGKDMKQLSKKEIAEEMFFKGIAYTLENLDAINKIDIEEIKQIFDLAI